MKTLHTAYRVTSLERSAEFYTALGYRELGRVVTDDGSTLAMLLLPDDAAVTLELVLDPRVETVDVGNGFSHIVVQVDNLKATLSMLAGAGIAAEAPQLPGGPDGPKTSFLQDPDSYRIELVEWPPGHADGITDADVE